jgi:hypothetical protein
VDRIGVTTRRTARTADRAPALSTNRAAGRRPAIHGAGPVVDGLSPAGRASGAGNGRPRTHVRADKEGAGAAP